jgi:hypothetical protein
MVCVFAVCALALLPAIANAQTTTKKATKPKSRPTTVSSSEAKLPEAVKKTFDAKFPNAMIEKAESEKEGGVTVWDIEFRDGRKHKETDIAEDGKMLESTEQVAQKSLPKEAMKAIKKAAEGGKINRTEKVDILYEIKDGKWAKVDKSKTQYEANVTKGEQTSDIIVDAKGKVIEEPKWTAAKKPSETKAVKEKKTAAEK